MTTAKEKARAVVDRLPDGATLGDISYELYVLAMIEEGLADVAAGRVVTQAEVEKSLQRWLR